LRVLIKKSVAVIAPTSIHFNESLYSSLFSGSKKNIIPFIYDIKIEKKPYTLFNNKKVIFACGRLIYYKGFENLIDAAKFLPDDCIVKIAGEGPLKEYFYDKINKNNLNNKVILLGRINNNDLEKEFANCYLFCLPSNSRGEMFGVVQVEAFAHGKPVVSTNIPGSGVSEVNISDKTGFLVEINNPQSIATAIKKLLYNESLYNEFVSNALERANYFTDYHIIDYYIELFERAAIAHINT
jgi:glycosyltransferase involved in cell wall biosynthesis